MDFLPIAVLIVFVLVGGIIAVIADELGRRIGKRRLTLHRRIRPKRTAQILTFFSGTMITLITILLIGFASSDMRILLLQGRASIRNLKKENDELVANRDFLRTERDKLLRERDGLKSINAALKRDVGDKQKKIDDADKKLGDAQAKYASLQTKSSSLQSRLNSVSTKLASVGGRLAGVNKDLQQRKRELAAKTKEYAKLQKNYADILEERTGLLKDGQNLRIQKQDLEKQLKETNQEIETTKNSINELKTQRDELLKQKEDAQSDLNMVQAQLSQVKTMLNQANSINLSSIERTRFRPLIFSFQEEVLRMPIPAHTTKEQVKSKIESALTIARDTAKSRGAQDAEMHAIFDGQGEQISIQTQKDKIASELAGAPDDQVLIVYSWSNAFADENMILALTDKPNPVIYQQGQTLAEVWVDGRKDTTEILDTLNGLGTKVRERALKDKMLPSSDRSLGMVSPGDIVQVYNDIRASQGNVRVRAITKRQIRAADPLALDFKVK